MIETGNTERFESNRTGRFLATVAGMLAFSLACFGVGVWGDNTGRFGQPIEWVVVGAGLICAVSAICMAVYTLVARPDILMPRILVVTSVEMPNGGPALRRVTVRSRSPRGS